jgi:hypothetical protein
MDMTIELAVEAAADAGFKGTVYVTQVALRAPSGGLIVLAKVASHQTVDCSSYMQAVNSIDSLISFALYQGVTMSRPAACAAVWSVPDGATLQMALDNVGCEISVEAAERMESWGSQFRKAVRGGPRR